MLELYHSINSVCAQKVRIALAEKELPYKEHLMTLGGDQFDPAYMKLNPNAVVPTLIHDGQPIIESSVILYYLDEAFPEKSLMPVAPLARAKVRLFNKLIDEYVHNSCTILTFATAFRPGLLKMTPEEREAGFAKAPSKQRSAYKRDVVAHGLDSRFVKDAVELLRLSRMWDGRPNVAAWWERVRQRPSTDTAIFNRMMEGDAAPFKSLQPDPWPKVQEMLLAAA